MAEVPRDANKLVVFNFLQWLADLRAKDPNLAALENLEVATQCLTDAFGVELANEEQQKSLSIKPMALSAVIEAARFQMEAVNKRAAQDANDPRWLAFLATLKKSKYFTATEGTAEYQKQLEHARTLFKQKSSAPSTPPIAPAAAPASPSFPTTATTTDTTSNVVFSPEDRKKRAEEAEKYKAEGNQKLSDRQYHAAVEAYSRAIELNPANAIYFANRAAAYEFLGDSEKAILDCKESIRVDPNYAKAYSRLGLSFFSLGCYKDAVEQYRKAVQLDANNSAYRESLTKAELKLAQHPDAPTYASRSSSPSPSSAAKPPPAAAATTPGGGAAAASTPPAGAGGASSLPQMPPGFPPMDPEAMKGMMNDLGGLGNIMSNPAFLGMAQKMMSDPQFMQMAQSMMQNPEMATMLGNMAHAKK